ncbi:MAG: SGNH/GDSL hydrolase family protein [Planctomycetota bacterium]|jgi:outer membrane lipase/esterase
MRRLLVPIAFCVLLHLGATAALAEPFSQLVVFGDSLSDTGNVYQMTFEAIPQCPPNFDGRFSNGPVWVEQLSSGLGLPAVDPSREGGTNNAYGGAETGGGFTSLIVPNLGSQISAYLGGHTLTADELIVVWGGANDFLNAPSTDPSLPVSNLSDHITTLAGAGGENFLVPNLPPLGKTPRHRGGGSELLLDDASRQFNGLLADRLDDLETSLQIEIFRLDVFELMQNVMDDPASFGFTNVTQPALDPQTGPRPDADQYLFWDGIHPTAAAHRMLGDRAAALVPEPSGLLLAALAALGLWAYGRRRSRLAENGKGHLAPIRYTTAWRR